MTILSSFAHPHVMPNFVTFFLLQTMSFSMQLQWSKSKAVCPPERFFTRLAYFSSCFRGSQVRGVGRVTTDQGGAGGTREPGGSARLRVSAWAEGGRIQGGADRPRWSDGIGGGATGSSRLGEAGGCTTCGSTSQQGVSGEDEELQASSRGRAGGLVEVCGEDDRGKLDVINNINSNSQQANEIVSVLSWNSYDSEQTDDNRWDRVGGSSSVLKSNRIPSATDIAGSHHWLDALWGTGSGAMVSAVPSS